ncbi:hypothetical protein LPJ56_002602, partial [Coemansia sp. RSA 2599]
STLFCWLPRLLLPRPSRPRAPVPSGRRASARDTATPTPCSVSGVSATKQSRSTPR